MEITPIRLETLVPPKDDLLAKIKASDLTLEEHDVIAVSSKVVSIWQGRCVAAAGLDPDELIRTESELYLDRDETPGGFVMHTVTNGLLIPNAGIDPFGGYYILWPTNVQKAAEELLAWFKETYGREHLYLIITDSRSVFQRRGVVGMAIAWAGFEPLFDNRYRVDLLGFPSGGSQTNIPDSLAASAVFCMGEANEGTPVARLRGAPYVSTNRTEKSVRFSTFIFTLAEDIFAPFLSRAPWKTGGATRSSPEEV